MWGIYLTGLWCLGTHPPAHGRLPPDALVLYMCGSYFSSAVHIREKVKNISAYFKPEFSSSAFFLIEKENNRKRSLVSRSINAQVGILNSRTTNYYDKC
jgi:hypothetical protein